MDKKVLMFIGVLFFDCALCARGVQKQDSEIPEFDEFIKENVNKKVLPGENAVDVKAQKDDVVAAEKTVINASGKKVLVDKILKRLNGVNVLKSDLEQPRIGKEGGKYSLDEHETEELLFQYAAEKHMLPTATDIERQIVAFKIQNNLKDMTDQEFEDELKVAGFTMDSYKNQMGRMLAVENVKHTEISEKIVVTSQEVEAYHKENPTYTKEEYKIQLATVPEEVVKSGEDVPLKDLAWENLGWVEKKDLGKDFKFIFSMKKGDVSKPQKINGKLQIVKLDDKKERRLKTLNEQYGENERTLQLKKKSKAVGSLEKELRDKAVIVTL